MNRLDVYPRHTAGMRWPIIAKKQLGGNLTAFRFLDMGLPRTVDDVCVGNKTWIVTNAMYAQMCSEADEQPRSPPKRARTAQRS